MQLHVYLSFEGNCQQALDLYAEALNGKVEEQHLYSENPEMCKQIPVAWHSKIMHASFRAGEIFFMASDVMTGDNGPCSTLPLVPSGSPVTLSLNFNSLEQQQRVFDKLAVGGKVTMPLADTFWGARFGMLSDKFGIKWMFNYDYPRK